MPLQETSGTASYDAFGGGTAVEPVYIESVFSTYLYTGNGTSQSIVNGIDVSTYGGMTWIKNRSIDTGLSVVHDTARGTTQRLSTNLTDAQVNLTGGIGLTAFNTNGFTVGTGTAYNGSGNNLVSWTFRKQPKFFDVVTYTGNGSAGRTVSHSLGSVPGCIIIKRTDSTSDWPVYHAGFYPYADQSAFLLNSSASTTTGYWNNTLPTSTVFTVNSDSAVNASGGTYVAYLFANQAGGFGLTGSDSVVACGAATGGSTVTLGWEPQWVMIKAKSASNWKVYDTMRGMPVQSGGSSLALFPNTSDAESNSDNIYPTATGFTVQNLSGTDYLYIAIRRGPMKVPTDATKVFSPNIATPSGNTSVTTGFPVDLNIFAQRSKATIGSQYVVDRLRGSSTTSTKLLYTDATSSEGSLSSNGIGLQNNTGINDNLTNSLFGVSSSVVYWNFGRAPSFFDEVCYTGNGAGNNAQTHNLGVAPELLIIKNRSSSASGDWYTFHTFTSSNFKKQLLDTTDAQTNYTYGSFLDAQPTSTTFTVNSGAGCNESGVTYVSYLFATCAGVSKVTSFTGNGSTQTINCGFTSGARFVMIKATSTTGNWLIFDTARGMTTSTDPWLALNSTAAESATTGACTTTSVGFTVDESKLTGVNTNAVSYIVLAVA